jgi:hypothetical protein
MRDVRILTEILLAGSDWSPAVFMPYAQERTERIRRLRLSAQLTTDLRATFTPEAAKRLQRVFAMFAENPSFFDSLVIQLTGPESVSAEAFESASLNRILAL